jgi:hypothetical protein
MGVEPTRLVNWFVKDSNVASLVGSAFLDVSEFVKVVVLRPQLCKEWGPISVSREREVVPEIDWK